MDLVQGLITSLTPAARDRHAELPDIHHSKQDLVVEGYAHIPGERRLSS